MHPAVVAWFEGVSSFLIQKIGPSANSGLIPSWGMCVYGTITVIKYCHPLMDFV